MSWSVNLMGTPAGIEKALKGSCSVKITPRWLTLVSAFLLACFLTFLGSTAAAESLEKLPGIQTQDLAPRTAAIDLDAAGVESYQVAAAFPGHPLERAANLVNRVRPLRAVASRLRVGVDRRQSRRAEGRGLARLAPRARARAGRGCG